MQTISNMDHKTIPRITVELIEPEDQAEETFGGTVDASASDITSTKDSNGDIILARDSSSCPHLEDGHTPESSSSRDWSQDRRATEPLLPELDDSEKFPVAASQDERKRGGVSRMPKDRGWAWMCVLGAFVDLMIVIGTLKLYGVLFIQLQQRFQVSPMTLILVPTIQAIVGAFLNPLFANLGMQITNRVLIMLGGLIFAVSHIVSGLSDSIEILIIFYGVGLGVAISASYPPAIISVAQYFDKRRSFANGITVAGSGVGGLLMPPLLQLMLDTYGYTGCMLIQGAICLNLCVAGALQRPPSFYTKTRSKVKTDIPSPVKNEGTAAVRRASDNVTNNILSVNKNKSPPSPVRPKQLALVSKHDNVTRSMDHIPLRKPSINLQLDVGGKHMHRSHGDLLAVDKDKRAIPEGLKLRKPSWGSLYYISMQNLVDIQQPPDVDKDTDAPEETLPASEKKQGLLGRCFYRVCFVTAGPGGKRVPLYDLTLFKTDPLFVMYFFVSVLQQCTYSGLFVILPGHAVDLGYSKLQGALLMTYMSATDIAGRLTLGWLADTGLIRRRYIAAICLAGGTVTMPMFCFATSYALLVLLSCVIGLCCSCYFVLMPVLLSEVVSKVKLPAATGLAYTGTAFGAVLIFTTLGWLRSIFQTWHISFLLCTFTELLAVLTIMSYPLIDKLSKKESDSTQQVA